MSRKEKKEARKKRKILLIIEIIFIIIMIYSGTKILLWFRDNQKSKEILSKVQSNITIDTTNEDGEFTRYKVNFDGLKAQNDETVAWLKVNGTDIEYPVVKHSDNYFYLDHSYDKSVNGVGWVFADYTNKFDSMDRNIVVYGHNRRDGSMFGTLKNILDAEWYNNEKNRYVTFVTENENCMYEVFSVYRIEKEDYYIQTKFTDASFKEFIETIKSRSLKDFGVDVTTTDKILTLSTCANDNKYRVVLHAKKIA